MFIIIPFLLIFLSLAGISFILWRKVPYLQKLTPESHQMGPLWHDLFPELIGSIQKVDVKEYYKEFRATTLVETEKLLRRIRLLTATFDRLSDSLIKKIRQVHVRSVSMPLEVTTLNSEEPAQESLVTVQPSSANNAEVLKDKEQNLIIAIAHDPKNSKLYKDLGDVYIKMKNFEDAKESFETALKFDPENEKFKQKLSFVLEKIQKTEIADLAQR